MGVCAPWATVDDVVTCSSCADEQFDEALLDDCLLFASEVLWGLSGRRWSGRCTDTVRPCTGLMYGNGLFRYRSTFARDCNCLGVWTGPENYPTARTCSCRSLPEVSLGRYPIREVVEVIVDGDTLDPSAYRVDDYRWLVRVDGDSWPCCQDLAAPLGDPDTFGVTFEYGSNPPHGGVTAAATLACHLALAKCGSNRCKLPDRVQNITRQGVTMTIVDPMQFLDQGKTGLYEVDLWLASLPKSRPTTIASHDVGRTTRRAGTDLLGS